MSHCVGDRCALQDGLYVPTKVEALTGIQVTDVACGGWHTVCLAEGGAVYVFGRGEYGRLGLGDDRSRATPVKVRNTLVALKHVANRRGDGGCVPVGVVGRDRGCASDDGRNAHDVVVCHARSLRHGTGQSRAARAWYVRTGVINGLQALLVTLVCAARKQAQQQRTRHLSDWIIHGSRRQVC